MRAYCSEISRAVFYTQPWLALCRDRPSHVSAEKHRTLATAFCEAAAGVGTAQGSAQLLLQVGTAWGQPELPPLPMVGDCSPQRPVSICKPVAFGMIQMNGVQVYSHQCQVCAMLSFASVRGDLSVQHVQLDLSCLSAQRVVQKDVAHAKSWSPVCQYTAPLLQPSVSSKSCCHPGLLSVGLFFCS